MLKALISGAVNTLKKFLTIFDEARCLPANSRRVFKTDNTREYPVIEDVSKFVKTRINILENAGSASLPSPTSSKPAQRWTKLPNVNGQKYAQQHEKRVAFLSTTKEDCKTVG
ncbi:uncharacterized protein LOC126907893 [Daktulosphaira vitifoliae]|uniref:uncharacterized protein LOC126907893 n=1 Tax=Daktulosphaira vitifoliae TaxID=58002 RepID=UPI0021AAB374|nr:uncharacterized protein LOC126907893 [Daktulosphaira vitifoliae]